MNPKTTIGLVIALVIAAGTLWWAQSSSQPGKKKEVVGAKPIFTDLKAADITGYEFHRENAPVCSFVKEDKWHMTSPVTGPAESGVVANDVNKIVNLKYVEAFKPGDPDGPSKEMTGLDKPGRTVKLADKGGKSYVLKIGQGQKLSRKTYVQREGDEHIYLVEADLNNEMQYGVSDYRSKRVAEFAAADAVKIEVAGEKNYSLVKTDGKWMLDSPEKGRADAAAVNKLLQSFSALNASKYVEDEAKSLRPYGLEHPRFIVTVSTEKKKAKPQAPTTIPASAPAEPEFEIIPGKVAIEFGGVAENSVFAKLADAQSKSVFQLAEDSLKNVAPALEDIRDKKVVTLAAARVQKIRITSGADSVGLSKSDSQWKITSGMEGAASDVAEFAAVDDLLKALGDLSATGYEANEDAGFGFASPRATLDLTVEGEVQPVRLVVGGLTPSKTGAYVKNANENLIAVVKPEAADKLIEKPASFLSRQIAKIDYANATRVDIQKTDQTISVEREGGAWKFTAPMTGKAESVAVNNVLSDLSNLRGRRVVGRASEAAKYGLDHPNVRVTVTVQPPAKPVPTTQPANGTTQPAEGPETPPPPVSTTVLLSRHDGKVYAMAEGGATICEVDMKVVTDLEAELLDTHVIDAKSAEIKRVAFGGETPFVFEKEDTGWKLAGEATFRTDPTKVTEVLETLANLKAVRFVKYAGANLADYGLDKPVITVTVDTDGGQTIVLSVSQRGPTGTDRYAAISTQPGRVFVMKGEDVLKLTKKVADFVNNKS